MASSKNKAALQARNDLPHVWRSPLMYTPIDSPLYCCYSVLCPYCSAYQLRGRALHGDWSRFTCCGGSMPCSGACGESSCPRFCAATEGTMFCLQYLNCICSIVACLTDIDIIDEAAILTDRIADIAYCSVCACMQTQHKLQMDQRDGLIPPSDGTAIHAPGRQQMNRH